MTVRAVFILRVTREAVGGAWRAVVELVGADRRTAVSSPPELVAFIERSLETVASEEDPARGERS